MIGLGLQRARVRFTSKNIFRVRVRVEVRARVRLRVRVKVNLNPKPCQVACLQYGAGLSPGFSEEALAGLLAVSGSVLPPPQQLHYGATHRATLVAGSTAIRDT